MPNNANDQWVDVPATPKAGAGDDGWVDVPQEPPKPRSRGFLAGLKSSIGLENPQAPRLADVIGENILGPGYDVGRGLIRGAKLATRPSSELPENMQTIPRQAAYRAASALAPAIGVDPESIEERGRNEDRAGILGEVAVPLATSMYRGGREPAARALREEEGAGAIRPGVRDAASVTGAIGGFASDPGYGGLFRGHLAGKYAPKLVDMITPKLKGRTPPPPVPRLTEEIAGNAPGTLPSSEEFYQHKAEDLMRRGREQEALDREARRNAPRPPKASKELKGNKTPFQISGASSSANPKFGGELPKVRLRDEIKAEPDESAPTTKTKEKLSPYMQRKVGEAEGRYDATKMAEFGARKNVDARTGRLRNKDGTFK